jgi:hypothetical protein
MKTCYDQDYFLFISKKVHEFSGFTIRDIPLNQQHKNFKGVGNIRLETFSKIKHGADKRKIIFDISIENLWDIYLRQFAQCAISGLEINFSNSIRSGKNTASLDRINPSIGYVEGNIQWVHKDVNRMKWRYDQSYYIDICHKINNYKDRICAQKL